MTEMVANRSNRVLYLRAERAPKEPWGPLWVLRCINCLPGVGGIGFQMGPDGSGPLQEVSCPGYPPAPGPRRAVRTCRIGLSAAYRSTAMPPPEWRTGPRSLRPDLRRPSPRALHRRPSQTWRYLRVAFASGDADAGFGLSPEPPLGSCVFSLDPLHLYAGIGERLS
jgi:hypothetical protein